MTDDVVRSLALATHVLGVDEVVVMQHTGCGLTGVTDEELQERIGSDREFLTIDNHAAALEHDLDHLIGVPELQLLVGVAGFVYDVVTGQVDEIARRSRS